MINVSNGKMADQLLNDMEEELGDADIALREIAPRIRNEQYEAIAKVFRRMEWILKESQ